MDEQWMRAMDFIANVPELNYLTQIVIMLYEDPNESPESENRFHIELHFSPGEKIDKSLTDESPGIMLNKPAPMSRVDLKPEEAQALQKAVDEANQNRMRPNHASQDSDLTLVQTDSPENANNDPSAPGGVKVRTNLQRFLNQSVMHRSAPERSTSVVPEAPREEASEVSTVPFVIGTPPLAPTDSQHNMPTYPTADQLFYYDQLAEQSSDMGVIGGLGSGQNPLFSHKVIYGGSPSALDAGQRPTEPAYAPPGTIRGRTRSVSNMQNVVPRNTVSAPDITLKNKRGGVGLEYEDYSMVTSISPLETLHNSLNLRQMDAFLGKMIENDTLGGHTSS